MSTLTIHDHNGVVLFLQNKVLNSLGGKFDKYTLSISFKGKTREY
jgi:hypothetical protein